MAFIFLAGCAAPASVETKLDGISFDVTSEYNGTALKCAAKAYGGGMFTSTVLEPESIAGTEIAYDGSEVTITYMGLTYKPSLPLPNENINDILNTVITSASGNIQSAQKDGDVYVLEGSTGRYDYILTVTESGLPLWLECPSVGLKAEFSNVTILKSE